MSDFIKHILDFEADDNFRGNYLKHLVKDNFEMQDNFIADKPKHILDFEADDNFMGN